MNIAFFEELARFTREALPGSGARAMVVYGNGRHFSAGAEPEELKRRIRQELPASYPDELPRFLTENTKSFQYIEGMRIPTFAAIRGTCLGSGLELALCCKFRICAEGAVLGLPESSFGLMPGGGGSVKLPAITGKARAMELILSGRNFSAEEAYQWGIVQRVVPRKEVVERAVMMAKKMISDF
jgi:enoyl-CoA hydratase/carnithine racemase